MTRSGKPFDEEAYNASRAPELISDLQATMTQARLLHAQLLDTIAEMDRNRIAWVIVEKIEPDDETLEAKA